MGAARFRAWWAVLLLLGPVALARPAAAQDGPPASEAITWGIRPSSATGPDGRNHYDYDLDPGDIVEDWVGVSNFTNEPLELAIYATDAFTSTDGHFDLLPAAEQATDVGTWIAFAEESVTIPPRARLDIPFRLAIPERAEPGDHAGGIVASLASTTTDSAGNPLTVDRRVGARIYLRVSGALDVSATVTDVALGFDTDLNPASTGDASVTYAVANTGNIRITGTPVVEVAGPFGLGRRRVTGAEISELLPGDELTFTTPVPSVAPLGRLTATVRLAPEPVDTDDAERALVARAEAGAWALPWSQLVTGTLLALALVLARRRERRRRRARAAELDAARTEGRMEALAATDAHVTKETTPT